MLSTLEESENPFPEDLTYLNLVFEDGEDEDLSPHLEVCPCQRNSPCPSDTISSSAVPLLPVCSRLNPKP